MILSAKDIGIYIDEFKKISYDDITNRNGYLSVEEIDTSIKELSDDVAIDSILIKQELHDLMQMLDSKHNLNSLFDFDAEDAEAFKKYIIQIKINALSEVKKTLQKTLPQTSHALHTSTLATNGVTIKDAIDEYINSKSGISKAVIEQDILNLNRFLEYTDIKSILYVDSLKHNDLIEFRKYRQKLNPKSKPNTINRIMANVSTFVKYCVKVDHLHKDIAKDIKLKLTIKEKLDTKRDVYEDTQIKKIFDNIDLIKQSPKKKKLRKYHNEYPLIIKLAMYSGAREQELCQLTKKDIKVEDGIHDMDLNIDTEGSSIKNIFSIRKVPIHPDILQELLAYMKPLKRDNLFTIPASQFSIDYGAFKTLLGFDRKLVFHSFRNTLQNKLKQQKVQNMIINELVGHSSMTSEKMTDGYTNKYNLEILHEELLKVKYDV